MEQNQQQQQQQPLRILSLDGGGVRGYSMLLLLQEIMHKLFVEIEGRAPEKWEIPRPCDHFDLIGGTGTGGLIAVLLGRLRLDIATALEIYVDMTRYIFEEEKTVGGIPYGKTLYKASKLEEATKEVVSKYESKDTKDHRRKPSSPVYASSWSSSTKRTRRSHTLPSLLLGTPYVGAEPENAWKPQYIDAQVGQETLWYDERPGRCRTFVTAVYKGSRPSSPPAILRTFESASESCPVGHVCTIWEAARATCAIFPAFKPIQIGQSVFMDEGRGTFNPSLLVLEEANVNEWPGREIGVFLSIGSGRLPSQMDSPPIGGVKPQSSLRESIIGVTPLQKFVEARENHKAKIGECEQIHLDTAKKLRDSGISDEVYFRLNVDEGVGDKGMAEWARLADISNGTRTYLAKPVVQKINKSTANRLANIWRQKNEIRNKLPTRVPVPNYNSSPATIPLVPRSQPRHATSRPIIPNLASEFGRLNYSNGPQNNNNTDSLGLAITIDDRTTTTTLHQQQSHTPLITRRPAPPITDPPSPTFHSKTTSAPLDSRFPLQYHQPKSLASPAGYFSTISSHESTHSGTFGGYTPNPGMGFTTSVTASSSLPSLSTSLLSLDSGNGIGGNGKLSTGAGVGEVGLGIELHRMTLGVNNAAGVGIDQGYGQKNPPGLNSTATSTGNQRHYMQSTTAEVIGEYAYEDEEVALHFRELQKIAGKIEREAMWATGGCSGYGEAQGYGGYGYTGHHHQHRSDVDRTRQLQGSREYF